MVFSVRYCFLFSCQCNLSPVSFKRKRELELRFNDDIACKCNHNIHCQCILKHKADRHRIGQ